MSTTGTNKPCIESNNSDDSSAMLDVIIVGGGLSGLVIAHGLHQQNQQPTASPPLTWALLEASSRLGGRLVNDSDGDDIDLGGAWIWPDFQPRMKRLVAELNITTMVQPDDPTSTRVVGGAVQLIHALADSVPTENLCLQTAVVSCSWTKQHEQRRQQQQRQGRNETEMESPSENSLSCAYAELTTTTTNTPEESIVKTSTKTWKARRIIFCVPPKVVSKMVTFQPPLSAAKRRAMDECRTWMAAVTKIALVYPERFWDAESSNLALPRRLTMTDEEDDEEASCFAFQVYDASTHDQRIKALTFFAFLTPTTTSRSRVEDGSLAAAVAQQLGRVWQSQGKPASWQQQVTAYTTFHVQRWFEEKYVSEDPQPDRVHPHPHPVPMLAATEWEDVLHFAASETDQESPGVMEGAVGSAQRVLQELQPLLVAATTTS